MIKTGKLNSPQRLLDIPPDYIWKKGYLKEGPPVEIRFETETVKQQMLNVGFSEIRIYDDLPKHFLVIGRK